MFFESSYTVKIYRNVTHRKIIALKRARKLHKATYMFIGNIVYKHY